MVYFNDNDKGAVGWLRNAFPDGTVDERSINDLKGADLGGYERVHLFAGIGGWQLALEYAGWPAGRPVWTGSCPCQPFSLAGSRKGVADPRHLWPQMYRLIRECKPPTVFGEQVASDDGLNWLAGVRADLEEAGYAVGCADMPAASVGSPQQRQRLWWVADSKCIRLKSSEAKRNHPSLDQSISKTSSQGREQTIQLDHSCKSFPHRIISAATKGNQRDFTSVQNWTSLAEHWKSEPTVGRVVDGFPNQLVKLRGYGNAIVPQVAAHFIRAFLLAEGDM